MRKIPVILGLCVILSAVFMTCSKPTNTSGSSETENSAFAAGVKGRLLDANNNPVSGAIVRLYPVDYVPSIGTAKVMAKDLDTTDADGVYEVPSVDTGTYNLEGKKDTLGVFIDSIDVVDDTSITNVPPGQLKKLGKITGITHMPGQSDTNQVRVNIYIPGTNRITLPNIGGKFTFDLMPAGRYQIIINPTLPTYNVKIIDTTLNAGELLNLDTIVISKYEPDTIEINTRYIFGVWGPNRVYRINTNVELQDGRSLKILPNTKIILAGWLYMQMNGSFEAVGTPDSLILFSCNFPNPKAGDWQGIYRPATDTTENFILKYCILEYAEDGVMLGRTQDSSTAVISNCVFRYCGQGYVAFNPNQKIFNNIFHDIYGTTGPGNAINNAQTTNIFVFNNIFVRANRAFYAPEPFIHANNNDFYNIDAMGVGETTGSWSLSDITNLYLDPKFISFVPGQEDYHLQSNSPCIGTGMNRTDMGIYSTYEP